MARQAQGPREQVNASDVAKWLGLVRNVHRLYDNYTSLSERNEALGMEATDLASRFVV